MTQHLSHHPKIKKLNRISGQVDGIKKMIEEQRYCIDIITQLRAVRSAVKSVEAEIMEAHLHHCVSESFTNPKDRTAKLEELKNLFKRFD